MIAKHALQISRYTPELDPFSGELGDGWGPPEIVYAYSIGPHGTELDGKLVTVTGLTVGLPTELDGKLVTVTGLTVGLPHSYGLQSRDRVILDGVLWEIDGDLVNSNRGPWSWQPGYVAYLTRSRTL